MEYDLCLCEGQKERSLSSEHNEEGGKQGGAEGHLIMQVTQLGLDPMYF